jgi:hypothetical protein
MTNFEHYKEEILNITDRGYNVAVVDNKPVSCGELQYCEECQLANADEKWRCHLDRMKWLYEEYEDQIEQPKLTKKERQFCELVETGCIARCKNGDLYIFSARPTKLTNCWFSNYKAYSNITLFNVPFSFITWDDAEPWSIEDLLKLEVEE